MWQTYLKRYFWRSYHSCRRYCRIESYFWSRFSYSSFFNPIEHHGDRTFGEPTPVSYFNPFTGAMPADGHLPSLGKRCDFDPLRVLAQLHGFDLVAGTDISEGLDSFQVTVYILKVKFHLV